MAMPWLTMVIDLMRYSQKMSTMNVVWPVTALYLGPAAVWLYFRYRRLSAEDAQSIGDADTAEHEKKTVRAIELQTGKPFWAITAVGVTYGNPSWAPTLSATNLLSIVFQYMTIAPMRGISGIIGIWAAGKADTLDSLSIPHFNRMNQRIDLACKSEWLLVSLLRIR